MPLATGSMEPVSCLSLPAGDREGNNDDYVATVEFQRMWPVFLRVSREDHIPVGVSNSGGGEILFLGCILDAFHMRLKTQGDISTCLSAIADVTKADSSDGNHRTHLRPNESHSEAKGSSKEPLLPYNCPDVFSQAESGVGNSSQTQLAAAGPAHGCVEEPPSDHLKSSLKSLPGILFEPAPSPGLRGSSSGVSEGSRPNDIAVTLPSASKGDGGREERFAGTAEIYLSRPSRKFAAVGAYGCCMIGGAFTIYGLGLKVCHVWSFQANGPRYVCLGLVIVEAIEPNSPPFLVVFLKVCYVVSLPWQPLEGDCRRLAA